MTPGVSGEELSARSPVTKCGGQCVIIRRSLAGSIMDRSNRRIERAQPVDQVCCYQLASTRTERINFRRKVVGDLMLDAKNPTVHIAVPNSRLIHREVRKRRTAPARK